MLLCADEISGLCVADQLFGGSKRLEVCIIPPTAGHIS
jgi:hypothetical protein